MNLFITQLVQIRRNVLKKPTEEGNNNSTDNNNDDDEDEYRNKKPQIFVDYLLSLQKSTKGEFSFTDAQIRDQTLTLLNGVCNVLVTLD